MHTNDQNGDPMDATTALHAIVPLMETKAGLHELTGALYDAASAAFDAHDLERWNELRDLAEYVGRVAEATPFTVDDAERAAQDAIARRNAARRVIVGCRSNLYCECDACNTLERR